METSDIGGAILVILYDSQGMGILVVTEQDDTKTSRQINNTKRITEIFIFTGFIGKFTRIS